MNNGTQIADQHPLESLWRVRFRLFFTKARTNWSLFTENKIGIIGLVIIIVFALAAIAHPLLMRWAWAPNVYDPVTGYAFDEVVQPAPPSTRHLLGTDPLGRDVLSQLMYSTQAEFMLGLVAALVTVLVATTVGAISAYFGGAIDTLFMRLADIIIMMPGIAFLIVLGALFDLSIFTLALTIGVLTGFGATAVVIKSQALSIKVKPYIEAARVAGGGHGHVIRVHLIPNLLPLAFLYMMFTVTTAIFAEAVLSFFGILNIRMSWGLMIHTSQTAGYILSGTKYWWLLAPSGAAITFLCASFYLVGRALDEIVNPRLRRR
jgi:peptide/nickel transport system permease protein